MNVTIESKDALYWKDRKRPIFGLPLSFTKYQLTEDRLFVFTGFLNTTENEVRLYRVLDLSVTRSIWQRMFGVGTIHVSSSDKTLGNFLIKDIKRPHQVKEMLSDMVEKQRELKRVVNREYMGSVDVDDEDDDNL
ncbi:MAG: PH domain-containing protein [Pseudobutyrivibrio sp.]|nr:PH domain-containing protein [Pseudobutyrivibrio sp.]